MKKSLKKSAIFMFLLSFQFAHAMSEKTAELAEALLDNPDHAEAVFKNKLEYIVSSHEYGDELMADFDKAIELGSESKRLLGSKTYKDLQALYAVKKNASHELSDLLTYFESSAHLPSRKDAAKKLVTEAVEVLKTILSKPKNKIALSDFAEELSTSASPSYSQFKYNVLDYIDIGREIKSTVNSPMKTQVMNDVKNLEKEWDQLERKPSSIFGSSNPTPKIEPSAGKNGNILGYEFEDGTWAITFDDGPSKDHTPNVLKNLKDAKIKATFFVLAQNLSLFKDLGLKEKSEGHCLANHSFSHPQLPKLTPTGLDHEIRESTSVETTIWGVRPEFFRCPYGAGNGVDRIRKIIAEEQMIHVFWNVDTLDWQDKNPTSIFNRAVKQMTAEKHGVILFHDVHPQSVIASKKVMEYINQQKFKAVTLREGVDLVNEKRK